MAGTMSREKVNRLNERRIVVHYGAKTKLKGKSFAGRKPTKLARLPNEIAYAGRRRSPWRWPEAECRD